MAETKPNRRAKTALVMLSRFNAAVYRFSGGRLMGKFANRDICVVRTTGSRSSVARDIPLMYVPNGAGVILVASLGGAPNNPAWYHNLVAHPDIEVVVMGETRKLRARVATKDEKTALWPRCVAAYPPYQTYQDRAARDIPLFICEPR
jgi:deazaflavin-dependent oxidoreductase (nitroreductase family)